MRGWTWRRPSGSSGAREKAGSARARRIPEILGFLSALVADVRRDLDRRPLDESRLMARVAALPPARDFAGALRSGRPALIAEVKRASPSAGEIADVDAGSLAAAYEEAGAAAISVLTEPRHFHGSLADLRAVRLRTRLPVLRKDFLIHPAQLVESRAEGADAALVIARALPGAALPALVAAAADLGLGCVVEIDREADLDRVLDSGAEIVGVNARDLETLDVDPERALALARRVPADRVVVVESGIATREQVERAVDAGATAVLVGEALMRASDPGAALRELAGTLR
jgi:indole-3-glycerol phosphate synthase